jgi:hypothetical protein
MSGTVNIARSLFLDEAFKTQPFTEREAFMWLVMEASWKDRTKRVGNVTVELKRGQLAASIRFMADAWQWEKSTVDRFLKRLEKRDMIGTDCGTGLNIITICKYNDYQGDGASGGTEENEKRDSSGTAAGQTRIPDAIPDAIHKDPPLPPKGGEVADDLLAHRKAKRAKLTSEPEGFDAFWQTYPHRGGAKKGRKPAVARYAAAIKTGTSPADILAGAERYRSDRQVLSGYAKDPTTWINQKCWADEIEPPQAQIIPITGARNGNSQPNGTFAFDVAHREYTRRLAAGEIYRGPDPSDPFGGR